MTAGRGLKSHNTKLFLDKCHRVHPSVKALHVAVYSKGLFLSQKHASIDIVYRQKAIFDVG